MIATLEHVHLIEVAESLSKVILNSEIVMEYKEAHENLYSNKHAVQLIDAFNKEKEKYEEVERFGRYHPDYNAVMSSVRAAKREMDLNELVAQFKKKERNLQSLLDEISLLIAESVSSTIMVPNADQNLSACSTGGCSTGGACGCG